MIIPIKTVEEMNDQERREYLEDLIMENVLDDPSGAFSREELQEARKLMGRVRRAKDQNRTYFTPSEVSKMVGKSSETIRKEFRGKPGVKIRSFGGAHRRTVRLMVISRKGINNLYPEVDIDAFLTKR